MPGHRGPRPRGGSASGRPRAGTISGMPHPWCARGWGRPFHLRCVAGYDTRTEIGKAASHWLSWSHYSYATKRMDCGVRGTIRRARLLDHLVGGDQQLVRHGQAKRLRGLDRRPLGLGAARGFSGKASASLTLKWLLRCPVMRLNVGEAVCVDLYPSGVLGTVD